MKPKTMILMVVAVACGLGASYMTSKLLADRNKQDGEPTVSVLVAKARVVSWQPIKDPERFFEIKQFPQSVAPPRALGDFPDVLNQRLNKPLDEGKPVTKDDLLTKEQQSLSDQLLPGQRAIAIKVTAESLAGGFVLPGTRVDVICTTRGAEATARIILQRMLVLAVDTADQRIDGQKSIIGQTVTLAVTPEEATRLSVASAGGELRLLLQEAGGATERTFNVVSKWSDLDKPLKGDGDKERDTPKVSAAPSLVLPEIKDEPPPAPETKPVVEKKRKRHVMTIRQGHTVERAVFLLGQIDQDDEDSPVKKEESKEDKKETKKPAPPKPAPPVVGPPVPPPPSAFGKSTRTGRIN